VDCPATRDENGRTDALRADAAQSALCAYLSLIALGDLEVNAIWHVAWADPVAALVVTPLIGGRSGATCRDQAKTVDVVLLFCAVLRAEIYKTSAALPSRARIKSSRFRSQQSFTHLHAGFPFSITNET
jgi:hypothetical protein